jgi:hypothetical protein
MKRLKIKFFQISLYKLNYIIEESLNNKVKDKETKQALNKLLPIKHRKYRDYFSKVKLN